MTPNARGMAISFARFELRQAQQQRAAWLQILRLRLRLVLVEFPFEFAELLSACMGVAWGIVVLNPYADTFNSSPSFQLLADNVSEWQCGLLVLIGGTQALLALFYGGWIWRVVATFLGFLTWLFLGVLFFSANTSGLALVLYLPPALASAFACCRIAARKGLGLWGT